MEASTLEMFKRVDFNTSEVLRNVMDLYEDLLDKMSCMCSQSDLLQEVNRLSKALTTKVDKVELTDISRNFQILQELVGKVGSEGEESEKQLALVNKHVDTVNAELNQYIIQSKNHMNKLKEDLLSNADLKPDIQEYEHKISNIYKTLLEEIKQRETKTHSELSKKANIELVDKLMKKLQKVNPN